jgi:hypothetical protein
MATSKDQDALASALLSITREKTAVVQLDHETRAVNSFPTKSWPRPISVKAYEGSLLAAGVR